MSDENQIGRFIFTDINLKPVTMNTLKYTIYSPSNNKMQQKSLTPNGAVNHFHFQLDKYAEQGEWRIEVEAGNQDGIKEETYTFDVEEYVLPKVFIFHDLTVTLRLAVGATKEKIK